MTTTADTGGLPPSSTQWGLFDLKDRLWLGDESGPKLFTDRKLSRASATLLTKQFNYKHIIVSRKWEETPIRLVDEVDVDMTPEEALKSLEAECQLVVKQNQNAG